MNILQCIVLAILILAPGVLIIFYILKKNKYEKNPYTLMFFSCFFITILTIFFVFFGIFSLSHYTNIFTLHILNSIFDAFFGVALIEESIKLLSLREIYKISIFKKESIKLLSLRLLFRNNTFLHDKIKK